MLLRNTSLRPLLLCLACCLPTASVDAGVIPWTYNAIFGAGPMYSGWGGWGAPFGGGFAGSGYGWGGGYPLAGYYGGYTAPTYGVAYGPSLSYGYGSYGSYGSYSAVSGCSSCSDTTVNYAPGCASDCVLCNSGCGTDCNAGCGTCSSPSTYSPPPDSNPNVQPTPAGTPTTTPKDDFGPTQNRNNDSAEDVGPSTDAPGFERPARAPAGFGDEGVFPSDGASPASGRSVSPSGGTVAPMEDDITPSGGSTITPGANPFMNLKAPEQVEPLDVEPAVATTTMPIRRRTSFTTSYRVPTAVRVAVTPAPRNPAAPQVATK